jgi:hypothetical protein
MIFFANIRIIKKNDAVRVCFQFNKMSIHSLIKIASIFLLTKQI